MSTVSAPVMRWNAFSAGVGCALWVLALGARSLVWRPLSDPDLLILLAIWVIAPLALLLIVDSFPHDDRLFASLIQIMVLVQPFAGLLGGFSLLLAQGIVSAILAAIWLVFTALAAVVGMLRLMRWTTLSVADACLALALVYFPIGGLWLTLACLSLRPLGFSDITVTLTAAHFHVITLAALTLTGLTGKARQGVWSGASGTLYRIGAIGMLVTPLLVATGITVTHLTGEHMVESGGALALALSLIVISFLGLREVVPTTMPLAARGLLIISYGAVVATMLLAIAYVLGPLTGLWSLSISQMIATHGWLNALAFGLCGLLGWRLKECIPWTQGKQQVD